MNNGGAQQAIKKVVEECNIKKKFPSIRSDTAGQRIYLNVA